jgi:hypothetical protein
VGVRVGQRERVCVTAKKCAKTVANTQLETVRANWKRNLFFDLAKKGNIF